MKQIFALVLGLMICVCSHADFVGRKGVTLAAGTGNVYDTFTVTKSTQYTLYFASDYQAVLAIFDASDISRFTSGSAFNYYHGFDAKFGIVNFTLAPGSYAIGARNKTQTSNTISYELEEAPVVVSGATYEDTYFTGVETMQAGSLLWQPFTVQSGFKYVVEGLNTGIEYYLISASALSNFRNRQTFSYFPDYSGSGKDTNMPGLLVIDGLAPGDYYLAFRNTDTVSRALVYAMYRYRISSAGGSGGGTGSSNVVLEGTVSYSYQGSTLTLKADRISNNSAFGSGALQWGLWASATPFNGGQLNGYRMGKVSLNALGGNYFYDIPSVTGVFTPPPNGTWYVTMTLEEQQSGTFRIVDYRSFTQTLQYPSTGNPDTPPATGGWPSTFSGVTPQAALGLPYNNIGTLSTSDGLIYTCLNILTNQIPDTLDGISRFDIGILIVSEAQGLVRIVKTRAFNTGNARKPNGQLPSCSGRFETTTNRYRDYIQVGGETFLVEFQLVNADTLTLQLISLTAL